MPLKDQMATGKLCKNVAGRGSGEWVIPKVEEVGFNLDAGGKQHPPCRNDGWDQGRQHPTRMHTGAPRLYRRGSAVLPAHADLSGWAAPRV